MSSSGVVMASILIKDIPPTLFRALQMSAMKNGRSLQDEVNFLLEEILLPKDRINIGSALAAFGDAHELVPRVKRDKTPATWTKFQ